MKKYDDDLEFGSLNEDSRDSRFIVPIIIVAVLLVIVIAALILIGKNGKNKDTSADPVATEQSGTTEEEAQLRQLRAQRIQMQMIRRAAAWAMRQVLAWM